MPNAHILAPPARLALGLAAALLLLAPAIAPAADKAPAQKDSRPAMRPHEATLTARVEPAEAQPGDVVTLKVTAKVEAGWHIYARDKVQPDDGPKVTELDPFDLDGLAPRPGGDWPPDAPPIKKHDPAFPDLPFVQYHEDEVTWSLPLVVPAAATPGKHALKVQAGYMICSEQSCTPPGRWTLPAAVLTVKPKGAARTRPEPRLVRGFLSLAMIALADPLPAAPKRKDSRAAAKPKTVTLTAEMTPAQAKRGETVTLKVKAKLEPGYHIYKYAKEEAQSGPKLTQFDLFDPAGLVPSGDWTPDRDPIKKAEKAFPGIPFLEFYEGEVTWSLPLTVASDLAPGEKTIRVQAGYMICDDKNCSIPGQWSLPGAVLTVLPGDPVAPTTAPAPAAIATTTPAATPPAPAAKDEAKPPAPAAPEGPKSDVERQASLGIIPFLLTCMGGGLVALAMPCVWPMIPITVNFFVKQGQRKEGGSTTGLAITYCLAIIGVFTGIGILFSAFFGASSLSALANNPWVNFGVTALFLAFGLSLLGLFEIRLPTALLNASAKGEGRGGLVGVMFMALTLTITSFTCTFPVVGGLLVMAAGGNYIYPVIGLATFAGVIALPFFLLALSPGLLSKVPKSGDWMNTVKVVGGLIEIGAAFKFLNVAECAFVVPEDAYFNAYTVLTIWVVLALVCGIYLLGLFRTDHDQEAIKVGPGRMILGSTFLVLTLFLAPALFGQPPKSRLWYLVVGLLPADAGRLNSRGGGGGGSAEEAVKVASSTDPETAAREQTSFHGVSWGMSYPAALEQAKTENKPILIDFTGVNCANCRLMESEVFPKSRVIEAMGQFVRVQLYTDSVPIKSLNAAQRDKLADDNLDREVKLVNEATNPLYVVLAPDETVLAARGGKMSEAEFLAHLEKGLADHRKRTAPAVASVSAGGN